MYKRKNSTTISKIICMLTAAVFMFSSIMMPVYGATETRSEQPNEGELIYETQASSWRYQDGYNVGEDNSVMAYNARALFIPWSKTAEGYYINSEGNKIEGALAKGIDVSYWQGNINWDKVKADGIEFAILRCGYGMDQRDQDDSTFIRNVKECERIGMPYGVYLYSYANTEAKAKSEAQHTLRMIREAGATPDYPIYYDLEDKITADAGRTKIIKFAEIYCAAIEAAGYDAGIYASLTWWNNYLNSSSLDKYDKWIAQWNPTCDYKGGYQLWQYTNNGTVDGISGRIDMNFSYELPTESLRVGWYTISGNTYYADKTGVPVKGLQTIGGKSYFFNTAGVLQKSKWVTVSDKKYYLAANGQVTIGYKKISNYYYYFDAAGIMKTGKVAAGNKQYNLTSSGKAVIHTAKIKTKLNYRTGPSTKYKKKGTYKKGKTVSVIRTSGGWSQLTNGYWVKSSYTTKKTTYPVKVFKKYKVKVKTALNYRTGPSTKDKKKGTYKKGKVLTIVASKNGWGKTSGGYWIKLSYTKKI